MFFSYIFTKLSKKIRFEREKNNDTINDNHYRDAFLYEKEFHVNFSIYIYI